MKKILIGLVAVVGITAVNVLPFEEVHAEPVYYWAKRTFVCPDGITEYQKCVWRYSGIKCDPKFETQIPCVENPE